MLLGTGLVTAATVGCGGTPPSSWRLGALLSSDDYGWSVEREALGQVSWRALAWRPVQVLSELGVAPVWHVSENADQMASS
jgi:hypothetical protein